MHQYKSCMYMHVINRLTITRFNTFSSFNQLYLQISNHKYKNTSYFTNTMIYQIYKQILEPICFFSCHLLLVDVSFLSCNVPSTLASNRKSRGEKMNGKYEWLKRIT